MTSDKATATVIGIISLPFLYVYCYLPIVHSAPTVAPQKCFSKSIGDGIDSMVRSQLSDDIYTQLTASQQKKIQFNKKIFTAMLTVSKDYTIVHLVNRNNGSVSCNTTFHASFKKKDGKSLTAHTSGNYTLSQGSDGIVYSVPGSIAYSLYQNLNNALNND